MIHTRFKKVLLVAPELSWRHLSADFDNIQKVHAVNGIFPAIYELIPNLIIFDYNYVSKDMEKIVRRIRSNTFYNKMKICCYKVKAETQTDGLLKAIGVDYFVYEEELKKVQKSKTLSFAFSKILDLQVLGMMPKASN